MRPVRTTRSSPPALDPGLFQSGDRVLVAVSGGADSIALAHRLAQEAPALEVSLVFAHVDHGWRGEDAARQDRRIVERTGATLGIPVVVSDPPPTDSPRTEAFARRYRYHVLHHMAIEHDCSLVATAHHAGDQAETFLMRLLRGSGPIGLAGIPKRRRLGAHCEGPRVEVVRPLLEVDPADLRGYLQERKIKWSEDETNRDVRRDRARIRERLRPHQGRHDLARLAKRLRGRIAWHESGIEAVAHETFEHHRASQSVCMPRRFLLTLDEIGFALALRHAGRLLDVGSDGPWFTRRHIEVALGVLQDGGAVDLPHDMHLHVGGSRYAWLARRELQDVTLPRLRVTTDEQEGAVIVDVARLGRAPRLRVLERADTFVPPGRSSEVRIQRWLSKRGVPRWGRRGQLVVVGDNGVAWVVGHGLDAGHEVRPETRDVVHLSLYGADPDPV